MAVAVRTTTVLPGKHKWTATYVGSDCVRGCTARARVLHFFQKNRETKYWKRVLQSDMISMEAVDLDEVAEIEVVGGEWCFRIQNNINLIIHRF